MWIKRKSVQKRHLLSGEHFGISDQYSGVFVTTSSGNTTPALQQYVYNSTDCACARLYAH